MRHGDGGNIYIGLIKTSGRMKINLVLTTVQNIAKYFCTDPHHQLCFATIVADFIVR